MNKRVAFDFIFNGGYEYMKSWKTRGPSLGSLMFNLSSYGIKGSVKSDLRAGDVVDYILPVISFAPGLAFLKDGKKYEVFYLWDGITGPVDERTAARNKMQSNSDWFFTIMKKIEPSLIYVKIKKNIGGSIGSVSKVGDIKQKIEDRLSFKDNRIDPKLYTFIRVKATSSRISLFYIKNSEWSRIRNILDKLDIQYKVLKL